MIKDSSGRHIGTTQNSYDNTRNAHDPDFDKKWLYPAEIEEKEKRLKGEKDPGERAPSPMYNQDIRIGINTPIAPS